MIAFDNPHDSSISDATRTHWDRSPHEGPSRSSAYHKQEQDFRSQASLMTTTQTRKIGITTIHPNNEDISVTHSIPLSN